VKVQAGNDAVAFGDVMVMENRNFFGGPPHNPGKGGWPTIKYFNKETGIAGGYYTMKTEGMVCDELGPKTNYMAEYVLEKSSSGLKAEL